MKQEDEEAALRRVIEDQPSVEESSTAILLMLTANLAAIPPTPEQSEAWDGMPESQQEKIIGAAAAYALIVTLGIDGFIPTPNALFGLPACYEPTDEAMAGAIWSMHRHPEKCMPAIRKIVETYGIVASAIPSEDSKFN